jgi:23S rRNA (uracil1939-C5)-methyltransferase
MIEAVEVTGIAGGGAGVGRLPDGRVTFVHRTAPGERVEVEVVESKPRWTRSRLVRVLRPSPVRREAPCPYYGRCGGCTLQHMQYPAQLDAKGTIALDALQRIGGLDVPVTEVVPSPSEFGYRNRVTFTVRRGQQGLVAGFRALEDPDTVVDVGAECLLPEPAVIQAWAALRAVWGPEARRLPSGEELRVTVRATASGGVTLGVEGGYAPGRARELLDAVPGLVSVWHRPEGGRSFELLAGRAGLREEWGGESVELDADVFLQVNRQAAAELERHVLTRVQASEPGRVVDAYCGVGLYARQLQREGVAVIGIEVHGGAVRQAERALPEGRFLEGRVEDLLPEALPADIVILNPPRTGLAAPVPDQLAEAPPGRIVYVSCDPATLARDLERLESSHRVVGLRAFDLFPQTAHVETVVELERCATS